ncbi:cysteine dioxygenase [Pseudonocardia humida]|uniref:cysteine dioxygenase n=1 Tax=Pseudonocardia humida TaxID=2800819 RepID=UPI00207C13CE|nr:cysteine dioxygenase family protein [Pseudonocardia humida]
MPGIDETSVRPATISLGELTALTRRIATEVRAGLHRVPIDPDRRWYRQLRDDGVVDVWLIGWATGQSTELHDHGGSLGALTVVSGMLAEHRWAPHRGGIRARSLRTGSSQGFRLGHVHDVVNHGVVSAVSVHAYSPPLTVMSYYALDPGAAALRRLRTVPDGLPG